MSDLGSYVSVTKPTGPTFRAWLYSAWFHQILEGDKKSIMLCSMALPSKLCAALHGQSNVCSMCDCNPCRSLDLSVLAEILSGVVSNHGRVPEGTAVSTQGQHYGQYKGHADQRRSFKLSSG